MAKGSQQAKAGKQNAALSIHIGMGVRVAHHSYVGFKNLHLGLYNLCPLVRIKYKKAKKKKNSLSELTLFVICGMTKPNQ